MRRNLPRAIALAGPLLLAVAVAAHGHAIGAGGRTPMVANLEFVANNPCDRYREQMDQVVASSLELSSIAEQKMAAGQNPGREVAEIDRLCQYQWQLRQQLDACEYENIQGLPGGPRW